MTHKSGVKAESERVVSECCVTVWLAPSALDDCLEEFNNCPWEFPSADAEEPIICDSKVGCCPSVVKSNDEEQGFSMVGATASDDDFWSEGDLGISITLDKSMTGSEDNLPKNI